jgi:hypothetical protein
MVSLKHKLGFLIVLAFGFALSASGQGRGFAAPARGFSAPVRTVAPPMRAQAGSALSGVRRFSRSTRASRFPFGNCSLLTNSFCGTPFLPPQMPVTASPQVPNFGIVNGVPGLGFDYPHLAAINRGFNDQFGFSNAFNSSFFNNGYGVIPFYGSLPSYYPPYEEETPDSYTQRAQQPVFVVPSPQQSPAASSAGSSAGVSATPSTTPPPELGQLILVRGDGQIVMAVAFTVRNGQLTYVTNEGTRRSFPASELDKEATRQMNEANGTFVSIPN